MGSSELLELLLTQTWQVTAVIAVVWSIVKLFGRNEPYLAHSLWALVLIKCLTPPLWTSPTSAFSWLDTPATNEQRPVLSPPETEKKAERVFLPVVRVDLSTSDLMPLQPPARSASAAIPKQAVVVAVLPPRTFWQWQQALIGMWLVGACCCLAAALLRLRWFWQCVTASREVDDVTSDSASIEKLTRELASQLGLRRQVRTLVTQVAVGPAVIGLWRPTIVLPAMIIERRKRHEIEPLIAHELLHIRRGDLWWALVQTLATCLFWFHPLVWLASRMMTREAERSCDEQTIASLRCSPAVYARCLLDVLERKHQLHIAPALPGVRPMDITKNRMERIMRLGHGSRSRTPWWTAGVFLLGAATILPGAGFTRAQEEQKSSALQQTQANATQATMPNAPTPPAEEGDYKLKTYDVTDLLAEFVKFHRVFSDEADQQLLAHLPNAQFWSDNPPYTDYQLSAGRDSSGNNVVLGQSQLPAKVVGNELWVFGSDDNHQQVEDALKRYREYGFEQISVAVRYLTVSVKLLDELDIDWKAAIACDEAELNRLKEACEPPDSVRLSSASATVDSGNATAASVEASQGNVNSDSNVQHAAFQTDVQVPEVTHVEYAEVPIPTAYDIIDQAKTLEVLERCQKNLRASISQGPRVTMWNRQSAMINDAVYRPFVTGQKQVASSDGSSKSFEPQIKVLKAGSTLRMRNVLRQREVTEMLLSLNMSDITRVHSFRFSDEIGEELTIQQPVFVSQTMNVKARVPNGSSIIMKNDLSVTDNSETVVLFLATCLVMNAESTERLAAERDSQLKKIDERIAAEELRIAKMNEQKRQPDVFIRSAQPGEKNNLDELAQVLLKRAEMEVDLSGRLEYDINEDSIQIRGDSISLGSEEQGCLLRADTAQIVLQTQDGLSGMHLVFQGNVTLKMDCIMEGVQATADELKFEGGEVSTMELKGHVGLTVRNQPTTERDQRSTHKSAARDNTTISTNELSANSIRWSTDSSVFEVSGEGRYVHPIVDGAPVELSAERFRWNAETNELKIIP